jgi:hypothetical protein
MRPPIQKREVQTKPFSINEVPPSVFKASIAARERT